VFVFFNIATNVDNNQLKNVIENIMSVSQDTALNSHNRYNLSSVSKRIHNFRWKLINSAFYFIYCY
jgi:hypothetical protein